MSAATGQGAGAREIAFAPALAQDLKVEMGTGYLQPGGLVVHTGWSRPLDGAPDLRCQHPVYGGSAQPWTISTPDGHRAARFPYCTYPDAAAAAARIVAALPQGQWPADADTTVLLPLALEASGMPDMLPLTHRGKPAWGSGYGGDLADFWMPDSRAAYERMIAAHGRIPKNCQCCARRVREQKKAGWLPNTSHWPQWSVTGHRGNWVRPHCHCATCMRIDVRIGAFGPARGEDGSTVPGSKAIYPFSAVPGIVDPAIDRGERAFAWFAYFLGEAGHVVVDERDCVNLWPKGVRHDDALFCETGVTEESDPL
ncbi:hypothetical protein [Streptomyces sp. NPDC001652]|uniref:hypothetical protein n=1 Tax=Streptomyces sp. NPDC001652 TaxID=3154393 RepID=UPI0033308E56